MDDRTKPLPWGDMPYDGKTPREVVDDYVLVRGDLVADYAREQLASWIDRYAEAIVAARLADAKATEAVLRGEIRRSESALATFDDLAERLADVRALADEWERDDEEHLNTYGQHLPGSVGRMAELLRAVLDGQAPARAEEGDR